MLPASGVRFSAVARWAEERRLREERRAPEKPDSGRCRAPFAASPAMLKINAPAFASLFGGARVGGTVLCLAHDVHTSAACVCAL